MAHPTAPRYDPLSRALHWLTAIAVTVASKLASVNEARFGARYNSTRSSLGERRICSGCGRSGR